MTRSEGDRHGVLQQRTAAVVLERLLVGRQAGAEGSAEFPNDYDGIVAGAPANYWTHLITQSLWVAQATMRDPAAAMSREKFDALNAAVLIACDALDGVKDGVIENPARCRFDPKTIQCSGADGPNCLTARKSKPCAGFTVPRRIREPVPSSSPAWRRAANGAGPRSPRGPRPLSIADDHYKYVVFKNPEWDFQNARLRQGSGAGRHHRWRRADATDRI